MARGQQVAALSAYSNAFLEKDDSPEMALRNFRAYTAAGDLRAQLFDKWLKTPRQHHHSADQWRCRTGTGQSCCRPRSLREDSQATTRRRLVWNNLAHVASA